LHTCRVPHHARISFQACADSGAEPQCTKKLCFNMHARYKQEIEEINETLLKSRRKNFEYHAVAKLLRGEKV
jgi:hypothetical protein